MDFSADFLAGIAAAVGAGSVALGFLRAHAQAKDNERAAKAAQEAAERAQRQAEETERKLNEMQAAAGRAVRCNTLDAQAVIERVEDAQAALVRLMKEYEFLGELLQNANAHMSKARGQK